jgi:hypothetical protein
MIKAVKLKRFAMRWYMACIQDFDLETSWKTCPWKTGKGIEI